MPKVPNAILLSKLKIKYNREIVSSCFQSKSQTWIRVFRSEQKQSKRFRKRKNMARWGGVTFLIVYSGGIIYDSLPSFCRFTLDQETPNPLSNGERTPRTFRPAGLLLLLLVSVTEHIILISVGFRPIKHACYTRPAGNRPKTAVPLLTQTDKGIMTKKA